MDAQGTVIDYLYPTRAETKLDPPLIAIIVLGLNNLLLGFLGALDYLDLPSYNNYALALPNFILSATVLMLTCHALRKRIITESVMMVMSSLAVVLYVISFLQGSTDHSNTLLLFALGFIACSVIFRYRGEMFYSAISVSYAVVITLSCFLHFTEYYYIIDALFVFNGACFILYAGFNLAGYKTHMPLVPSYTISKNIDGYPEVLLSTVGAFMFALLSFSIGITMIDESGLMYSFLYFKLLVSSLVLMFGLYGLYHHLIGEGLTMTIVGMSSLIFAVSTIAFGEVTYYIDVIFGLFLLPTAVFLFYQKIYLLGVTASLLALVMLLEFVWDGNELLEIITILCKAVSTTFALVTWYEYDLGYRPRFIVALEHRIRGLL